MLEASKHWIESLNSTMKLDIQRTQGIRNPLTDEYSGLIGRLQTKEADISGNEQKSFDSFEFFIHQKTIIY